MDYMHPTRFRQREEDIGQVALVSTDTSIRDEALQGAISGLTGSLLKGAATAALAGTMGPMLAATVAVETAR